MNNERTTQPLNGYLFVLITLILLAGGIALTVMSGKQIADPFQTGGGFGLAGGIAAVLLSILFLCGFFIVNPNNAKTLLLFGVYKGTVFKNGFHWVNPFILAKKVSLRARNHNSEKIKVNDKAGNPIEIGAIVVWRVKDTFKALFEVDDYVHYVERQSEAALRQLAGTYPYDAQIEGDEHDATAVSLRAGRDQVNLVLEQELSERLGHAGVQVIEARLSHLAYAPEIAGAMLQRQQANAVVAARSRIVDGAVGMVRMALHKLVEEQIVELDAERKAAMVSNLLVVLCSHESVQPVINTGTLYT